MKNMKKKYEPTLSYDDLIDYIRKPQNNRDLVLLVKVANALSEAEKAVINGDEVNRMRERYRPSNSIDCAKIY